MKPPLPSREARPAGAFWNLLKTFMQTVAFWGFFLFAIPTGIAAVERRMGIDHASFTSGSLKVFAIVLFAICGSVGLFTGVVMAVRGRGTPIPFDCPRRLVITGPYRFVRNPMAMSGLTQGASVGLYLGSPGVWLYTLAGALVWNGLVRKWEEFDLEQRFGDEFRHYRAHVRCWIPRLRPYHPPADHTTTG